MANTRLYEKWTWNIGLPEPFDKAAHTRSSTDKSKYNTTTTVAISWLCSAGSDGIYGNGHYHLLFYVKQCHWYTKGADHGRIPQQNRADPCRYI